jgi:hypothetical protein
MCGIEVRKRFVLKFLAYSAGLRGFLRIAGYLATGIIFNVCSTLGTEFYLRPSIVDGTITYRGTEYFDVGVESARNGDPAPVAVWMGGSYLAFWWPLCDKAPACLSHYPYINEPFTWIDRERFQKAGLNYGFLMPWATSLWTMQESLDGFYAGYWTEKAKEPFVWTGIVRQKDKRFNLPLVATIGGITGATLGLIYRFFNMSDPKQRIVNLKDYKL